MDQQPPVESLTRHWPQERLAAQLARRLENEIIADGWPVGNNLGSEPALLDRHGVSRAVLREAVRILEHRGVATMRRGVHGGLIVAAPARDVIADTVAAYFALTGVGRESLLEVRALLESPALELASERLSEESAVRLRAAAASSAESDAVWRAISEVAANPALDVFLTALRSCAPSPPFDAAGARELVNALVGGRLADAEAITRAALDQPAPDASAAPSSSGSSWQDDIRPGEKLPHCFARFLAAEIRRRHLRPGDPLGSELTIREAHDVSRPVLRAAVRVLEQTGLVESRRGASGGLFAHAPDPERQAAPIIALLDFIGIEPIDIAVARHAIETDAVTRLIRRLGPHERAALNEVLQREREQPLVHVHRVAPDLNRLIARLSGSPPLELFTIVLSRAQTERVGSMPWTLGKREAVGAWVKAAHHDLVAAILDGDADLARLRIRRMLEAVMPTLASAPVLQDLRPPWPDE